MQLLDQMKAMLADPSAYRERFTVPAPPQPEWTPLDLEHAGAAITPEMIDRARELLDRTVERDNSYNQPPQGIYSMRTVPARGMRIPTLPRFSWGGSAFVLDPSVPPGEIRTIDARALSRNAEAMRAIMEGRTFHAPRFEDFLRDGEPLRTTYPNLNAPVTEPAPRICPRCGYTSIFTGELDTHIANCTVGVSSDEVRRCDECGSSFIGPPLQTYCMPCVNRLDSEHGG